MGIRTLSTGDKIEALKTTDLFGRLDDALLGKIAARAITRHLNRNQILYSEQEQAAGLFVIMNGEIRSVRQSGEGREQVLSTEVPGAVLAIAPLFSGGKYYSTMIADTPADVLCVAKQDVHALCREHPELLWNMARIMAQRIRNYAELIESLALLSVEERVAQYLYAVGRERGVRQAEGCVFEVTITRAALANRLGSTREVVSRALSHLQRLNLIHVEGRRLVTVPDMAQLGRYAGADTAHVEELTVELSSTTV